MINKKNIKTLWQKIKEMPKRYANDHDKEYLIIFSKIIYISLILILILLNFGIIKNISAFQFDEDEKAQLKTSKLIPLKKTENIEKNKQSEIQKETISKYVIPLNNNHGLYILELIDDTTYNYYNKTIKEYNNKKYLNITQELGNNILNILKKYDIDSKIDNIRVINDINGIIPYYKDKKYDDGKRMDISFILKTLVWNEKIENNFIVFFNVEQINGENKNIIHVYVPKLSKFYIIKQTEFLQDIKKVLEQNITNNLYLFNELAKIQQEQKRIITTTKPIKEVNGKIVKTVKEVNGETKTVKVKEKKKTVIDIKKDFGYDINVVRLYDKDFEKCNIPYLIDISDKSYKGKYIFSTMKDLEIPEYNKEKINKEAKKIIDGYSCLKKIKPELNEGDIVITYINRPYSNKEKFYVNYVVNNINPVVNVRKYLLKTNNRTFYYGYKDIYNNYAKIAKDINFDNIKKLYPEVKLKDIFLNTDKYKKLSSDTIKKIKKIKKREKIEDKEYYFYNKEGSREFFSTKKIIDNNNYRKYYFQKNKIQKSKQKILIENVLLFFTILIYLLFIFYIIILFYNKEKDENKINKESVKIILVFLAFFTIILFSVLSIRLKNVYYVKACLDISNNKYETQLEIKENFNKCIDSSNFLNQKEKNDIKNYLYFPSDDNNKAEMLAIDMKK